MSRIRPIAWLILAVTVALLCWQMAQRKSSARFGAANGTDESADTGSRQAELSRHPTRSTIGAQPVPSEQSVAPDALSAAPLSRSAAPAAAAPVPETEQSSTLPAQTVLENTRTTIRQYASALGENPVGTNLEITKALQGENPKGINFLKQDGNRVNANGELVDVWGTPYFFHQLSAREMEIRSAGPDRVMYTADDLLIR